HHAGLRSESADPRAVADGQLRSANALRHAIQPERAALVARRRRCDGRLRRVARQSFAPPRRRQPRARINRQWREDLQSGGGSPQPELHWHLAARDRRSIVLSFGATERHQALLGRLASAVVLYLLALG